jgi:hypothetical protein
MFDPLAAGAQLISLFGECLSMGIEFGFEPVNFRIAICDEGIDLLLLRNEKGQQSITIKAVQIGDRSAIHGRSMPSINLKIIHKMRINREESTPSSDCDFGSPCSFDSSPVDPFQKHGKLRTAEQNCSALSLGPDESSALQPLGKQTQTIAIPPQKFYDIASAPAKQEHMPREGLLLEHGLHLSAETIEAAPHVGHAGCNPDLRSCG